MEEQAIYTKLKETLVKTFEIAPEKITPEARFYEDLDLDSIDAVDMLVELKPMIGRRKLDGSAFQNVRTVNDVVKVLAAVMDQPEDAAAEK